MTQVVSSGAASGTGHPSAAHGVKPRNLIKFTGAQAWKLNLDVDHDDHHDPDKTSVEKSASDLDGGYTFAGHFEVDASGTAVRFLSHLNGAVTSGSSNPRTELREMRTDDPSKLASWKTGDSTARRLTAEVAVTHAPSTPKHRRVTIGQIHNAADDVVEIQYNADADGGPAIGYTWKGTWQKHDLLVENYHLGDWFTYRIEVANKTVRIFVDTGAGLVQKAKQTGVSESGCFFKAGAYTQSHVGQDGADAHDYGEALFRSIEVTTT